jgi:hypothetical protein
MRHRLPAALVLALLTVGVAGCSDDSEPDVAEPTATTSTPTSSAPTSLPPTTNATSEPETESAEEFIRRYAEAEALMENTGNAQPYLELTDTCSSCEGLVRTVSGYYREGGSVQWDGWKIRKIEKYNGSKTEFAVTVDSPPTIYRERAGGQEKRIEGGRVTYILSLIKEGRSWLIDETAQLSS